MDYTYTRVITIDELNALKANTDEQANNDPSMTNYDPTVYAQQVLDGAIQTAIDKGNNLESDGIKRDLISQIQSITTTDDLKTLSDAVTTTVTTINQNRKTPPIEIKP
jgi:hypothetical protein